MTKVLEKARFQFGHYELAYEVHGDSGIPCVLLHGILVGPVVPPAERRRQLTMATLVIGHRGDRRHTHRDAAELAKEIPNARLLETRWIGELRVRPDRLWPKIGTFLNTVSAVAHRAEKPPAAPGGGLTAAAGA